MTPDIIYDQMIGMGMAKKLIFSYIGNPGVGLLRRCRDSIENVFPRTVEIEEHSHAGMDNAYEAGAFSEITIPYLEDIPVLGTVLFGQDPLVYLLIAL